MSMQDDLRVAEGVALFLEFFRESDAASIRASITDEAILDIVGALTDLHRRAGALEDEVLMHRHTRQTKLVRAALSDDLDAPNVVAFPARQRGVEHGGHTGGGAA
ncbi:MAG: hypothetical protein WD046_13740 [Paracoccaceae bacterium]